jgi:hypothetical protein
MIPIGRIDPRQQSAEVVIFVGPIMPPEPLAQH